MIRLLTAVLLFASFNAVADVTLPNNLEENSVASATDVMDNFNALANEVNSQDSRITIVEQSVGGGTATRTFTFSGFVPDVVVPIAVKMYRYASTQSTTRTWYAAFHTAANMVPPVWM